MQVIEAIKFKEIIKSQGVEGCNRWRKSTSGVMPSISNTLEELKKAKKWSIDIDLNSADFLSMKLDGIILSHADSRNANLQVLYCDISSLSVSNSRTVKLLAWILQVLI